MLTFLASHLDHDYLDNKFGFRLELYKARQLRNGRRDCTMRPCGLAANSNYVSDDSARPRRGWGATFERKLPPAPTQTDHKTE